MLEKELQKMCFDWLKYKKIFCFKLNNTGIWKQKSNSYIPAQTLGVPDAICHFEGRVIYLEFKQPKVLLSKYQEIFQEQCLSDNIDYHIVRLIDDLEIIFR